MPAPLSPELFWLLATTVLIASLWIPHILALIAENGLFTAMGDGEHKIFDPESEIRVTPAWAARSHRAHLNALESLVPFAALVVLIEIADAHTAITATLCAGFFALRAGHYVVYTLGLPYIRTVLFLASYGVLLALAAALL